LETETRAPKDVLLALARQKPALELGSTDVVFLAALHLRGSRSALASFDEPTLVDVFEEVMTFVDEGKSRRRATHAIRRLRDQRTLSRVDHAGVVRRGEFALTRLGTAIAEFFLDEDALTREALTLLMRTLLTSLGGIVAQGAQLVHTPEAFRDAVEAPLRVTVRDLVSGIQRRQRGFDLQQEELRHEVGELLRADWFGAVERCQELLDATGRTLRELGEVILRDTHAAQGLLQDVQDLAASAGAEPSVDAARTVMEQVDRVAAWGTARQRAFSEYYQYVHRFLRDVVRLDPSRALTQRLRDQLGGAVGRKFSLVVAGEAPPWLLRDGPPPRDDGPPVKRPKKPREPELETTDEGPDPREVLEAAVTAALVEGVPTLSALTERTTRDTPPEGRFAEAGRVAEIAGKLVRPLARAERAWIPTGDGYELEEWTLPRKGVAR
jgi:chromosome partition protein MukF